MSSTSYLLKLFTHDVPLWHLPVAFTLVHLCLYAYLCIFRGSLLTVLSLVSLMVIGFRMLVPTKEAS